MDAAVYSSLSTVSPIRLAYVISGSLCLLAVPQGLSPLMGFCVTFCALQLLCSTVEISCCCRAAASQLDKQQTAGTVRLGTSLQSVFSPSLWCFLQPAIFKTRHFPGHFLLCILIASESVFELCVSFFFYTLTFLVLLTRF